MSKRPNITAGPWVLSHKDSAVVLTTANKAEATNPIVAECPGYKLEREANARAITALPELLEALEKIESELADIDLPFPAYAREALKKAGYEF